MSIKYSLVGVDGNAFSIMGYTDKALRREGLWSLTDEMMNKAMSGNYDNLIRVCMEYLELANKEAEKHG